MQAITSADEIMAWCRDYVARTLERPVEKIDPDAKLARLGLDSATSVQLMIAMEEWLGIELPPEFASEHPTLRKLSAQVAGLIANQSG